jgi:hypothetical protein
MPGPTLPTTAGSVLQIWQISTVSQYKKVTASMISAFDTDIDHKPIRKAGKAKLL